MAMSHTASLGSNPRARRRPSRWTSQTLLCQVQPFSTRLTIRQSDPSSDFSSVKGRSPRGLGGAWKEPESCLSNAPVASLRGLSRSTAITSQITTYTPNGNVLSRKAAGDTYPKPGIALTVTRAIKWCRLVGKDDARLSFKTRRPTEGETEWESEASRRASRACC
jgi:hypothetical protein